MDTEPPMDDMADVEVWMLAYSSLQIAPDTPAVSGGLDFGDEVDLNAPPGGDGGDVPVHEPTAKIVSRCLRLDSRRSQCRTYPCSFLQVEVPPTVTLAEAEPDISHSTSTTSAAPNTPHPSLTSEPTSSVHLAKSTSVASESLYEEALENASTHVAPKPAEPAHVPAKAAEPEPVPAKAAEPAPAKHVEPVKHVEPAKPAEPAVPAVPVASPVVAAPVVRDAPPASASSSAHDSEPQAMDILVSNPERVGE